MSDFEVVLDFREHMESWREMKPVLQKFAESMALDIHTRNPHFEAKRPVMEGEELFIYFYSVSRFLDTPRLRDEIPEVFGIALGPDQGDAITSDPDSPYVIKDEKGTVVAEVQGMTIFVRFDLPHGPNAGILTEKILDAVAASELLPGDPESRRKARKEELKAEEERKKKILEESGSNFSALYTKILESRVENIRGTARMLGEQRQYYLWNLALVEQRFGEMRKLGKKVASVVKKHNTKIPDEMFAALKKMAEGGLIMVDDDLIKIDLGRVDICYQGKVYDIGYFEMELTLDDDDNNITLINKEGAMDGYYHPHITGSGEPCFGNLSGEVDALIDSLDLDLLVSVIQSHLHSYNPRDAYIKIENWPIKKA